MAYEYPLLAPFSIHAVTAIEFKKHVMSLLNRPAKKEIKLKPAKPQVVFGLTPKGNLSVSIKRKPKWITRGELEQISRETKTPLNEVWLKVVTKGGAEVRHS